MKSKLFLVAGLAHVLCLSGQAGVILDLDASKLQAGELAEVADQAATGKWKATGAVKVDKVEGLPALVFAGSQKLVADFGLPAGFEKSPFTVEVWAYNPEVGKIETLLTLTAEKGGPGTEFSYGTGSSAGAFRSGFKATTPYTTVPAAKGWHHIAWTYGSDSMLRLYVDGELDTEAKLGFNVAPSAIATLGSSNENEGKGFKRAFSGALGRVRVQDVALNHSELRQAAGHVNAFQPSPRDGVTTDSLSASFSWQPGTAEVASYVFYAGTERAAVESATTGGKPASKPEFGPLPLKVGTQYFWRVAQLDKAGKVVSQGKVWSFTADPGTATEPSPRNNNSNIPVTASELKWTPGKYATKQKVYLATTAEELQNATKPAAEVAATATSCPMPTKLSPGTRYFWRVDSDNGQQPASRGQVWTFRTQDTLVRNDVTFFVGSDTHYGRENNAAINRVVIDEMNSLPGVDYPKEIGGKVATPRGVVLNGDLLDEGFNKTRGPSDWAEFCRDYGLTGNDGRLCFPAYEGFGNHDGGPTKSLVRASMKERNKSRVGLTRISENGLHYSWDWDDLHLVQLNLFGGSGPSDVKGVNPAEHDPELSLEFLKMDLEKSLGKTNKPFIAFQHFGWLGGMSDWWQPEAKERYYEAVKDYNVLCLINGHSHGTDFIMWHDIMTIHDGSTARGESDQGDFLVVHVTDTEVVVAQRKLGSWGMVKRIPRKIPATK